MKLSRYFQWVIFCISSTWTLFSPIQAADEPWRELADQNICKRSEPHLVELTENVRQRPSFKRHEMILREDSQRDLEFSATFFESLKCGSPKAPTIVLFPGLGGETPLDGSLAAYFAGKGMHVVLVHHFVREQAATIQGMAAMIPETVRIGLSLVDFISDPNTFAGNLVDTDKIALLGISYGALRAAYHIAFDARIRSTMLSVGGAPIADIMTETEMPYLIDLRQEQMDNAGIKDLKEYRERLKEESYLDVGDVWAGRDYSSVLMLISNKDRWVPTSTQKYLEQHLRNPSTIYTNLGHVASAISTRVRAAKILRFFKRNLELPPKNKTDLCTSPSIQSKSTAKSSNLLL